MDIIRELENEQLKSEVTPFNVGDTIRVYAKVVEGTRERLQMFEGVVIKRQGGGIRETFTVRRIASGVGVERTWPLYSPRIDRIEVVRRGVVRPTADTHSVLPQEPTMKTAFTIISLPRSITVS